MLNCEICNKKLGLTFFTCKCSVNTCIKHRWDHADKCTFDYKTAARKDLEKKNPPLLVQKVSII